MSMRLCQLQVETDLETCAAAIHILQVCFCMCIIVRQSTVDCTCNKTGNNKCLAVLRLALYTYAMPIGDKHSSLSDEPLQRHMLLSD